MTLKDWIIGGVAVAGLGLALLNPSTTVIKDNFAAFPGGLIQTFLELEGGVKYGNSNSTTTVATTYTMAVKDLVNPNTGGTWDTILLGLNGGAATFTTMASTSFGPVVFNVGDRAESCIRVSNAALTLAGGTGVSFDTASSSDTDLAIKADKMSCITWVKATTTDIVGYIQEFN